MIRHIHVSHSSSSMGIWIMFRSFDVRNQFHAPLFDHLKEIEIFVITSEQKLDLFLSL